MGHPGSLSNFLSWFAGYAENIDKAPTAKQWERIKAKIAEIRIDDQPVDPAFLRTLAETLRAPRTSQQETRPMLPATDATAPPMAPLGLATDPLQWRVRYQKRLIELGQDDESAGEDAARAAAILSEMPEEAAKRDIARLMPAGALEDA